MASNIRMFNSIKHPIDIFDTLHNAIDLDKQKGWTDSSVRNDHSNSIYGYMNTNVKVKVGAIRFCFLKSTVIIIF